MRLFVIGRDPQQADIVLIGEYVSNYHAEIIQRDNGDLTVIDKSTNGTYLNGVRLYPGKETPIKRGDNLVIADTPLDWSVIPEATVPEGVKAIRNIGSFQENDIVINGDNVSRCHASLRKMADGKWYIVDYSKNGTVVNNRKIQKNRLVRLKKGDRILCGGVPVENPVKTNGWAIAGICAAAACILAALIFGIVKLLPEIGPKMTAQQIIAKYEHSVVLMRGTYHFKVECGTLDITDLPDPDSYIKSSGKFVSPMYDEFIIDDGELKAFTGKNPLTLSASGFFIGKNGFIATNRHVAMPWETQYVSYNSNGPVTMLTAAEQYYKEKLSTLYELGYTAALPYISQIKVTGVLDDVVIFPNTEFYDPNNGVNCHKVTVSDQDADLALFRIRTSTMPFNTTYVPVKSIKKTEPKLGTRVYTMGFPFGISLQEIEKTQLQANFSDGTISRNNDKHTFGITAVSYHGASGSPVFDERGKLIGILNSGIDFSSGFNFAVRAKYLKTLVDAEGIQ